MGPWPTGHWKLHCIALKQPGRDEFEGLGFLSSFGPPGTVRTEGCEKTQPFKRFHSQGVMPHHTYILRREPKKRMLKRDISPSDVLEWKARVVVIITGKTLTISYMLARPPPVP